jgi:hypothetical protein
MQCTTHHCPSLQMYAMHANAAKIKYTFLSILCKKLNIEQLTQSEVCTTNNRGFHVWWVACTSENHSHLFFNILLSYSVLE